MNNKIRIDFGSCDKETNSTDYLALQCDTILKEEINLPYNDTNDPSPEDVDSVEFDNTNIHNSDDNEDYNPTNEYNKYIEYNHGRHNMDLLVSMEGKPYKKFIVADYVDYRPAEHISKCLIKNCERGLSGRRTGNIKRHYHRVHKFIIVHNAQSEDSDDLEDYYENEEFQSTGTEMEVLIKNEPDTSQGEENETEENDQMRLSTNLDYYIEHDPLTNKSRCLVPGCNRVLEGKKLFNIKRHYMQVHNCEIYSNKLELQKLKSTHRTKVSFITKKSSIAIEDLVIYDDDTNTHQCLFINCNLILEKNLTIIKKHYREFHKIIIAKDSDDLDNHRLLKKRKYLHTYRMKQQENVVKNEPIHDSTFCDQHDQQQLDDEQPQCSTASKKIKNTTSPKKKLQKFDITLTKQEYLKLCVGLIIKNDLPLSLFDDNNYFKPLLAHYEQLFDCNLNSTLMESIMVKANDLIVADLKEQFADKVVCLELFVIHHQEGYYLVFNVRFIKEEIIYNKIIGFSALTESADDIPISEYLKKFNINDNQVYTRTLITTNTQVYDCKLSSICYNICDKVNNIQFGPIYELQQILNIFIFKYIVEIKKWQECAEYDDKNFTNTIENFKKFQQFLENLNEHDIKDKQELENPIKFIKTLQICWNFVDKFDGVNYVVGDFYRDWLCCELELKELMKNQNQYAGELYEDISKCKQKLLEGDEFISALYLDPRFCFLGSRILTETQKAKAKNSLLQIQEQFGQYMSSFSFNTDNSNKNKNESSDDDEYALLTQHINDNMPVKVNLCLQDKLNNCVSTKREQFNLDILKYWRYNRKDNDLNQLSQIALTFPVSQYVLKSIENDFILPTTDNDKFDIFLIKHNFDLIEKHIEQLLEVLNEFNS